MEPSNSVVLALTGCIGSGKSTALEIFKSLGSQTLSADELAREIVKPGTEGLEQIVDTFGADVLNDDGELDRKTLGDIVFSSEKERKKLENITHPLIRSLSKERIAALKATHNGFIVYEIPLFFESGLEYEEVDYSVLVYAPEETCIERAINRGNISREQAVKRLRSQISIEEKRNLSDYILDNTKDSDHLRSQITALTKTISNKDPK